MAIKAELLFICRPQDGWVNEKYRINEEGEKQMNEIKDALDSLALALTEHNHVWSDELRGKYENAIKIIEDGERPCEDPGK